MNFQQAEIHFIQCITACGITHEKVNFQQAEIHFNQCITACGITHEKVNFKQAEIHFIQCITACGNTLNTAHFYTWYKIWHVRLYFQKLKILCKYNYSLPIYDDFCAIFENKFWPNVTHHIETYQLSAGFIWRLHQKNTTNYKEKHNKSEPVFLHKTWICCLIFENKVLKLSKCT